MPGPATANSLTRRQSAAVKTKAQATLVIAGAGSGKTRVLTERVARLLESEGASASSIMCLTFTRKAAGELRARLEQRLAVEQDALRGMLLGTFHSVAFRILRNDGEHLGYKGESLSILEPHDADMLLQESAKELGYLENGTKWKGAMSWTRVCQYRESQYTGARPAFLDKLTASEEDAYASLHRRYAWKCQSYNVLDFGQILTETRKLFTEMPTILRKWQLQVKHVLVDELQDSDETQYDLHRFFAPPATFFGVGDTRQSIYGFRGARPDLMLKHFPDAEVHNLVDCFRCGRHIVQAANTLIAVNAEPMTEPLVSKTRTAGTVKLFNGRSADIVSRVKDEEQQGYAWSDVAVLARNHRTLRRLKALCDENGVPAYRVRSGFDLCDTDAFRLVHAALRVVVNDRDDVAFLRLAGPALGLSNSEIAQVKRKASNNCWSMLRTAATKELSDDPVNPVAVGLYSIKRSATVEVALSNIFTDCNFNDSETLSLVMEWWLERYRGEAVADALRDFAMRDQQDDMPEGNCVTLATIHAAKGLEWPCVYVVGLNEGTFPSSQSLREHAEAREERRCAYVALTRAKERLCVHYREREDQAEDGPISAPSRFLQEAGLR